MNRPTRYAVIVFTVLLLAPLDALYSAGGELSRKHAEVKGRGRPTGKYADQEKLVADIHAASLKLREQALRKTIAKDTCWPPGVWATTSGPSRPSI